LNTGKILFLALLISLDLAAQSCKIYQYRGNDSTHKYLALNRTLNAEGKVICEVYTKFNIDRDRIISNVTWLYFYNDTFLTKKVSVHSNKDSAVTLYSYDEKGRKIKEETSSFDRTLKKGATPDEDGNYSDDELELDRKWHRSEEAVFSYSADGFAVAYYHIDSTIHRKTYEAFFDKKNRIIRSEAYNDTSFLYWTKTWNYSSEGFVLTSAFHLDQKTPTSATYRFKKNAAGHTVEKLVFAEKKKVIARSLYTYNDKGQLTREWFHGVNDEWDITHVYVYE
jgi:hypothetical protein